MTLSRRSFLAGLGASALTPFLPVLNASGQEQLYPKRLLLVYTPHGAVKNAWLPSGSETSFTLSRTLAPLERHKQKLVVLGGVNMEDVGVGAPHTKGLPLLWTGSKLLDDGTFQRPDGSGGFTYGWNSAPSVDQVIAARLAQATPYRTLEFGVRSGGAGPASRMIYTAAKQPLAPATDPWAQFSRLFTGLSDRASRERLATVALAQAELKRLVPRIAAVERTKLEAHLDALASVERRLNTRTNACKGPSQPAKRDPNAIDNTPLVMGCQLDLVTAAFACDLTRIASLQYSFGDNDGRPYPWLGISDDHHSLTHSADSDTASWDKVVKIRAWYAEQFALLLDKLAAVPEGDGTMLDNTMVVWGSELGVGNTHSFRGTPFVVAGGGGGAYATGRFLNFEEKVAHNRLLVSMCRVMGLDDVTTFGDTDVGTGPLPGFLKG
jgi:Protein of unknown function (DUF1552)